MPVESGPETLMDRIQTLPVNLLIVVDGYFPSFGGSERQVEVLAEGFYRAGHQVHILAPRLDRSKPKIGRASCRERV